MCTAVWALVYPPLPALAGRIAYTPDFEYPHQSYLHGIWQSWFNLLMAWVYWFICTILSIRHNNGLSFNNKSYRPYIFDWFSLLYSNYNKKKVASKATNQKNAMSLPKRPFLICSVLYSGKRKEGRLRTGYFGFIALRGNGGNARTPDKSTFKNHNRYESSKNKRALPWKDKAAVRQLQRINQRRVIND